MVSTLPRDANGKIVFDMLSDADCPDACLSFPPESKDGAIAFSEMSTNTEKAPEKKRAGNQSREYRSQEAQTSIYGGHDPETVRGADGAECRISPAVVNMTIEALDRNNKSRAFEGYAAEWEEMSNKVETVFTLRLPAEKGTKGKAAGKKDEEEGESKFVGHGVPAAALAWNCNGNQLAVGYGKMDIQGSDAEPSCVAVWNLSRIFIKNDKPDELFDTPSSVLSVAFHPFLPGVLAAGTFSGELLMWNIGKADGIDKAIPVVNGRGIHREGIAQIDWVYWDKFLGNQSYFAVTCSTEGRVVMWKCNEDVDRFWPLACYPVTANDHAKIGLSLAHQSVLSQQKMLGLTCMGVEHVGGAGGTDERGVFYLGCEAGGVLKCIIQFSKIHDKISATSKGEAFRNSKSAEAQDEPPEVVMPITFSYEPHGGPVHAVAASPLQRNLFISCGADCTLRLHNSNSAMPVHSFEPSSSYLYSASWSTARPLVFATGDGKGSVHIYDFIKSSYQPVVSLDMPDASNVYALAFNPVGGDMLAAGEGSGAVRVWKVAKGLTVPVPGELEKANVIGADQKARAE